MVQADTYNRLFTLHGVIMVFFFLVPSIPATLGNFLVPLRIGATDLAFPRINLLSWYIYVLGGAFTLWALIHGGVDTGWTFYTPFSTHYSNGYVVSTAIGVFIAGFSSILTGLNFVATIHRMRAPGMTPFRLPLFIWSHYATSLDHDPRHAGHHRGHPADGGGRAGCSTSASSIPSWAAIRSSSSTCSGSIPHPAVYIMVLPGMGVISELIAAFSRKRVFGYPVVAFRASASPCWASWSGATTSSSPASGVRRDRLLADLDAGRRALGDQGLQLDGHALPRLDLL